ncbi:MAG: hypothetical protein RL754_1042 [Bacteroidota bacterium]
MRILLLIFALSLSFQSVAQGSYIARLWNTKKYEQIISYSEKAASLSAMDNEFIGQAFMKLEEPQPGKALYHYDVAIGKKWQSEDLYFHRSQANYALGRLSDAMGDLEVCLTMNPNYQKYMLSKGAIAYEMGDLELAYKTYYETSELYDKQLPYYMLAVISLEREQHYKAQQWIDKNMLRFERGKEFWVLTAEQQVALEWRVFGDIKKALAAQNALLEYKPDNATYLIDRLLLLRLSGQDSLAQWAENDIQERYNTNQLPLEFYKKGSFKVGEYSRPNGIIEDYRTFRPNLFNNMKYARFYLSDGGQVLDKHWAGLIQDPNDTTARLWSFHKLGYHTVEATDTNYTGFKALFDLPDSTLAPFNVFSDSAQAPIDSTVLRETLPVELNNGNNQEFTPLKEVKTKAREDEDSDQF